MAKDNITYVINADSSAFRRELRRASKSFDRLEKSSKSRFDAIGRAGLTAAKGIAALTAAAGAATVAIGVKATKAAAGFERAIVSAGARVNATSAQLKQMEVAAVKAAAGAEFSARQAADAMGFLAAAGFNVTEQMTALPGVLNLASAGEMDLAQSADLASNVLAQFALDVEELGRVNDVLVKSANSANTSVYQLGEALSYSGPAAKGAGISIEETVAALSKLSDAGIQGDRAGTGFTQIMIQMRKAAKKMGVELSGADIASLGFAGSLEKLTDAGLTAQNAGEFFTSRAQVAVQALLVQGIPAIKELDAALQQAGGTAQEVADQKIDTLQGAFNILAGNIDNVFIALGQQLTPVIREAAEASSAFAIALRENDEMLTSIRDGFVKFADISADLIRVVGLATNVMITFGGVLGEVGAAFDVLAASARGSVHSLRLAGAVITKDLRGIYDAGKDLADAGGDYVDAFKGFGDSTNAANAIGMKFQDTAFGIADGLQDIAAKARAAIKETEGIYEFVGPMPPGQTQHDRVSTPAETSSGSVRRGGGRDPLRTDADRLLGMVETPFERYAKEIEKLDAAMAKGYISTDKYGQIVKALKGEFEPATIEANKLVGTADRLDERMKGLGRADLQEGLGWLKEAFEEGEIGAESFAAALSELQAEADYFVALKRESEELKESFKSTYEIGQESIRRYEDMLAQGLITTQEFKRATDLVGQDMYADLTAGVDKMIAKQEEIAKRWEDIWDSAAMRIGSAFSSTVGDAFLGVLEGNVDAVADAFKNLTKELIILGTKMAILSIFDGTSGGGILQRALGFAEGGYVSGPGTGTSDSIPAYLSNGEYVLRAPAVRHAEQHWGSGFLDDINQLKTPSRRQKFASGGLVGGGGGGSGGGGNIRIVIITDPDDIEAVMASAVGERVFINTISRRSSEIKAILEMA